jgi:hypothetical protein
MRKLAIICCFAIGGCCSAPQFDVQQAEDFRRHLIAKKVFTPDHGASVDPGELLRHIPVGTHVIEALMLLDDMGFHCEFPAEKIDLSAGTCVLKFDSPVHVVTTTESVEATAATLCLGLLVPESWARRLVSTNIHGELRFSESKVTGASLRTSMTGP